MKFNLPFKFPTGYDCGVRLKDVLQENVDEKYYLSEKAIQGLLNTQFAQEENRQVAEPTKNELIELTQGVHQSDRVYDSNGIARTLAAEAGGGGAKTGLYKVPHGYNKGGFREVDYCPSITTSAWQENNFVTCAMRGRDCGQQLEVGDEIANTITTVGKDSMVLELSHRIRKLTETECFVLMGFTKYDCDKCKNVGISNSQLYKQAGNSIVVNVLMAIFGQLYGVPWQEKVYGAWWKSPNERMKDLPLFKATKGETK